MEEMEKKADGGVDVEGNGCGADAAVARKRVEACLPKLQRFGKLGGQLADDLTQFVQLCAPLLPAGREPGTDAHERGEKAHQDKQQREAWEKAILKDSQAIYECYSFMQSRIKDARTKAEGRLRSRQKGKKEDTNTMEQQRELLDLMLEVSEIVDEPYAHILSRAIRGPAPLKPEIFERIQNSLTPKLAKALESRESQQLSKLLKREGAGVFSVEVFDPSWLRDVIPEANQLATFTKSVEHSWLLLNLPSFYGLDQEGRQRTKPGLEGVILNNFPHMKSFVQRFIKQAIEPVCQAYLEHHQPLKHTRYRWIEPLYAHIVSYAMDEGARGHFPHVDDSGLTINISLGKKFQGGALVVTDDEGAEITIPQVPGRAIIHNGSCLHWAHDIEAGERYNLVIWCSLHESSLQSFPDFLNLPPELQQGVVDLLPPADLCRLRLASRTMHALVEASRRWQWEVEQSQFERQSEEDRRSWRQLFMENCAKHRVHRLKGASPLAPLIATRFYRTPRDDEFLVTRTMGLEDPVIRTLAPYPDDLAMLNVRSALIFDDIDSVPARPPAQRSKGKGCQMQ